MDTKIIPEVEKNEVATMTVASAAASSDKCISPLCIKDPALLLDFRLNMRQYPTLADWLRGSALKYTNARDLTDVNNSK